MAVGFFSRSFWVLTALGGIYIALLSTLTFVDVQRFALYANKFHTGYWDDVSETERSGFSKHQVTPFFIDSTDNVKLYAWHVLPISVYGKHRDIILSQPDGLVEDFKQSLPYKLLKDDPDSKVIVSFHGNAGHVGQGFRPDIYRTVTGLSPHNHLIAIDYRGFGASNGSPTEAGLIADGISTVDYVVNILGIPPARIAILGQSLGTAVSSAVALHFASPGAPELAPLNSSSPEIQALTPAAPMDFAKIILLAPFTDLPTLLRTYRISGIIPVLSPLRYHPKAVDWMLKHVVDIWDSAARLEALTRATVSDGRTLDLHVVHAMDDWDIRYTHSVDIFKRTMRTDASRTVATTDLKFRGGERRQWLGPDQVCTIDMLNYGGHNRAMKSSAGQLAVLEAFGL
ncbi:alpha/beta-hydrolase [Eremomyces bilateralis CBS 781.70]|uniref:Alpha/beta-hydrolase n=1 Tax=Eremomyces bilateralis CBS 781.70 TaxID=1392243 RepID=A0A6G1G8S3_9PEZI|nr:alpha/beta-hydrolase [Eremomyces bilateralis CBS 781.70]KAF1814382.1 alpha/beta-hydrolase [Eremomyces bilateralis CBS 781.70]